MHCFFLNLQFGKITETLCFCDPTWKAESADLTFILSPYLQYIIALKMYCFFLPSQFCYNTRCRLIEGENRIRFPVSILQPPIFFFQNEKKMINSGLVFVLEIQHFPHHRLSVASQVQFESMLQFWVRSFSKATAQFLKRICNPYFLLEGLR